jgi:hypothetical protein
LEFKRVTNFEASDITAVNSDVTTEVFAEISSPIPVPAGVVCFAVSWGIDSLSNRKVYSVPVWLGLESITFPYP